MHSSVADDGAFRHTPNISAVCFQSSRPVVLPKLNAWLERLLSERWADVFRIKGIMGVEGDPRRFLLQGVHGELLGTFEECDSCGGGDGGAGVAGGVGGERHEGAGEGAAVGALQESAAHGDCARAGVCTQATGSHECGSGGCSVDSTACGSETAAHGDGVKCAHGREGRGGGGASLVIIGRSLSKSQLLQEFEACLGGADGGSDETARAVESVAGSAQRDSSGPESVARQRRVRTQQL